VEVITIRTDAVQLDDTESHDKDEEEVEVDTGINGWKVRIQEQSPDDSMDADNSGKDSGDDEEQASGDNAHSTIEKHFEKGQFEIVDESLLSDDEDAKNIMDLVDGDLAVKSRLFI
jgi:hypothetical protein